MKQSIVATLVSIICLLNFNNIYAQCNTWVQKADYAGGTLAAAISFSIGDKGYFGIGKGSGSVYYKELWEYDPVADTWTQKADFPGIEREFAFSFTMGTKGYIGTGSNASNYMQDFWEYDPVADTWTQRADFGGGAIREAVGFSIGSKGFVGGGRDQAGLFTNNFWEYDPINDTWTQATNFAGDPRRGAIGISINSKGYIGTGTDSLSNVLSDFWEYDPINDIWTQKADFGGGGVSSAVGITIGERGYVGTGIDTSATFLKDFWEYDPVGDSWAQRADFGGNARVLASGFAIGTKGYLGIGLPSSGDFWEYGPELPINISSIKTDVTCIGGSDGTITTTASGGSGALSYSIDGGTTFSNTTGIFTGLGTGSYSIVIQDEHGCTQAGSMMVLSTISTAINIILETATDIDSCGNNNGEITVVASGGTPPLSYSIDGGVTFDSSGFFTGLSAGNYDVVIQDALGCSIIGSSFTINDPSAIIITAESWTDVTGCLISDGTIIITASDTTGGPVSFSIDAGNTFPNTTGIFTGLGTGTYQIVVQDTNLCNKIGSTIIIDDPSTVIGIISSTPDTNSAGVGTASISSVSGGVAPYTYSWSNGSSNFAATGLTTGTYTVTVTDVNGCAFVDSVFVGTITNVKEFTDVISEINVYPNPNMGLFKIEITVLEVKEIKLKIVNLLGQGVYYEKITLAKGVNQNTIDLSAHSTGLYNLQLLTNDGIIVSRKIILER